MVLKIDGTGVGAGFDGGGASAAVAGKGDVVVDGDTVVSDGYLGVAGLVQKMFRRDVGPGGNERRRDGCFGGGLEQNFCGAAASPGTIDLLKGLRMFLDELGLLLGS